MMPTTVLYHGKCPDGLAAAFACWKRFGDNAEYLPVHYGKEPPSVESSRNLYIVDFSYPADILERLWQERGGCHRDGEDVLTVLDHHASAERDLATLATKRLPGLKILFDMDESGASLTWKYLMTGGWHPKNDPEAQGLEHSLPLFYKYVRDRDLWRWTLPDSKAVSMVYKCLPKDWLSIEQFAQDLDEAEGYHRIVTEGTAMLRYADALVQDQGRRWRWGILGGYTILFCNATTLFSEVGDWLCTTFPDIPFAASYLDRGDGKREWGLRARSDVDVSLVAKEYGGGGHEAAARFTTDAGWLPPPADQCP